jgi:hypothetical protein
VEDSAILAAIDAMDRKVREDFAEKHKQNRTDIHGLKNDTQKIVNQQYIQGGQITNITEKLDGNGHPGLMADVNTIKTTMTDALGQFKGIKLVGAFIAALLAILIAGLGLWFTSLESRGKVVTQDGRPVISEKAKPQNAITE